MELTPDERVARLVLALLHEDDDGWKGEHSAPEHFRTCPDVTVAEVETHQEMWFDTGVEATRLTALLRCPHMSDMEWEWADLGELPDLLDEMERREGAS